MALHQNTEQTTPPIPTVVIGHIDHGKSTLIGRLLYDSGQLPRERIGELQARAELYRRRFEFSHFLDAFEEEVAEERTIDTVRVLFHAKRTYEIADVPGHAEFTRNMLTGASDARIAILVVSVVDGIQAQTLEHLRLVSMLGVEHMIVAVTKLDLVDHDEGPFAEVVAALRSVLDGSGFQEPRFIPVVPITGLNIFGGTEELSWYSGPTLVEALNETALAPTSSPTRFVIQDTYTLDREPIHVGCLLSGQLRTGDRMVFQPSGVEDVLVEIRDESGEIDTATRGDCVGIRLSTQGLTRGDVGGSPDFAPAASAGVEADVVFFDAPPHSNEVVEILCGPQRIEGVIGRSVVNVTAEPASSMTVSGGLSPQRVTIRFSGVGGCLERLIDVPELGRFIIRHGGEPIGVGIVHKRIS